MSLFGYRCDRCHKRGHTSVIDFDTISRNLSINAEWRLCQACFPPAAADFREAFTKEKNDG